MRAVIRPSHASQPVTKLFLILLSFSSVLWTEIHGIHILEQSFFMSLFAISCNRLMSLRDKFLLDHPVARTKFPMICSCRCHLFNWERKRKCHESSSTSVVTSTLPNKKKKKKRCDRLDSQAAQRNSECDKRFNKVVPVVRGRTKNRWIWWRCQVRVGMGERSNGQLSCHW